jgi:mannose-6-phosphate isomerase-like protein (cupin superfamily)
MAPRTRLGKLIRWLSWAIVGVVAVAAGLILADSLHRKSCVDPELVGATVRVPGERMRIVRADAGLLAMDAVREPASDPGYTLRREHGHVHPHQEERFEILEGRARFLIGDEEVELGPGEVGVVPPDTVHHWMALDGTPVRVAVQFVPALDTGAWFVAFHGSIDRGEMNLLQAAVIASEYERGSPLPAAPSPWVWRLVIKILAPIGRLLGYEAC